MAKMKAGPKIMLLAIAAIVIFGGIVLLSKSKKVKNYVAPVSEREKAQTAMTKKAMAKKSNKPYSNVPNDAVEKGDLVIKIGVVTWGGYVGGQYFNEGFKATEASRFFQNYGFKVQFVLDDDFNAGRDAFKSGEIDLLWATVGAFTTEVSGLSEFGVKILFQSDWSRGGDNVIVVEDIKTLNQLFDENHSIACALMTPSHTMLLHMYDTAGAIYNPANIVEMPSAIESAGAFKGGSVPAAVMWSPDDDDCMNSIPGSHSIMSTKKAQLLIADVFIAKESFINAHEAELVQLIEGWMIGASEINGSDAAKKKAAEILSIGTNQPEDFCYNAINKARLCTYGDNENFFNLKGGFRGVKGEDIYVRFGKKYNEIGMAPGRIPSWRSITYTSPLKQITTLTGRQHMAEQQKTFTPATKHERQAVAIATKKAAISFSSGSSALDTNAKTIIRLEFLNIAKSFPNQRIRIEGNTDTDGGTAMNQALSEKRARSVANFLTKQGLDPNKFIVVGNGEKNPVASNKTAEGKAKNRRTELQLL